MARKEGSDETPKVSNKSEVEKDDDDFQQRLASLPQQHREEILRQYELPICKASLLSLLGFARWVEVIMMIVGSIFSIAAGTDRLW